MAERVGFEHFRVLQTKDLPLDSIALSYRILNFRTLLARF